MTLICACECPTCGGTSHGFRDEEGLVELTCWNCTIFPPADILADKIPSTICNAAKRIE